MPTCGTQEFQKKRKYGGEEIFEKRMTINFSKKKFRLNVPNEQGREKSTPFYFKVKFDKSLIIGEF